MANRAPNTERRKAIFTALQDHGPMTIKQISDKLQESPRVVQGAVQSMAYDESISKIPDTSPAVYSAPPRVALSARANIFERPTFSGMTWPVESARPGSMDHLKHPSRRGNELVPHTGQMLHMVSSVNKFVNIITQENAL
jgi:hypothetical protein